MPPSFTNVDTSTLGVRRDGGATDGAWMPTTESIFGDSEVELRVVRDSIKARLFPGLASSSSASGTPGRGGDALTVPRVGRFAVLRQLGRGGMGVVFLAYDEELDRKVAIKVLRRSRDPARSRARLTREAQALARLSHPNVVQIHEIGEHEGRVFIAMEYVRGQTLRRWLEAEARPWREILAVLLQAGRGLEAAHAAGLVHRDFKPDNVLVGEDGRVRVVDFGLVRADLHATSDEETEPESLLESSLSASGGRPLEQPLTRTGTVLGTPIYMSLEQHLGEGADALGDQYSFCATAWEALHGERPFAHGSHAELLAAIRGKDLRAPPKGSAVPRSLRLALERGLEPHREDRFASMNELLAALEAEVAPRRRSGWTLLGVGVLAAALASLVAVAWARDRAEAKLCELGPELLEGTWDEAARAQVQDSFAATQLSYADEAQARVRGRLDAWAQQWITARRELCEAGRLEDGAESRLLERRGACLAEQRGVVAGMVAVLREADARVVQHSSELLGRVPDPAACARVEVLEGRTSVPEDPEARAAIVAGHEKLAQARALQAAGRLDEAEALAQRVLDEAQSEEISRSARVQLGFIEFERAQRSEAVTQLRALAADAELAGDLVEAAEVRVDLAIMAAGRLAGPEPERWLNDDARVALGRLRSNQERRAMEIELAAARVAWHGGELERARKVFAEVVAAADARGHAGLAADAALDLAAVLDDLGEYERAAAAYADASKRARAHFGDGHPKVALVEFNLALHALTVGEVERAGRLLDRVEPEIVAGYGGGSLDCARVEVAKAKLAALHGRWDEALALLEPALDIHVAELGPSHEETGRLFDMLGTLRYFSGDLDGALGAYERALRVLERRLPPGHESLVVLHANLGDALLALGRHARARRAFDESLAQLELELGLDNPLACVALAGRGEIALLEGRPEEAIRNLEAALVLLEGQGGDSAERAETQAVLARALAAAGREPERVEGLASEARATFVELELDAQLRALDEWRKASAESNH
jgi:tetratricopeptide (TPR) repeat protein/tRNA A-37 threonylcarbamoyl transferase component Bud32